MQTKRFENGADRGDDDSFHLAWSAGLPEWMLANDLSLGFSTYTRGKVVLIGPGQSGSMAVSERNFGHAMAMRATPTGLYLSTAFQVWHFENALNAGRHFEGWDRLFMPRGSHVTGTVDIHDIHLDRERRLLAAVTQYNCLAELDSEGSFSPLWRPAFIDRIVNQDRCHLNGFCLEDGVPAFVTLVGETNAEDGWRAHRAAGGQVIDIRSGQVVGRGLSMPHTPRIHRGELYVLEAGSGWLGRIDRENGGFERLAWCPGFLRGLNFVGDFAVMCLSKPRHEAFSGLPLDAELSKRGREPECALYVVRLSTGEICHRLAITGAVEEVYDTLILPGTRRPLLIGLEGKEIGQYVVLGTDRSSPVQPLAAHTQVIAVAEF